jgi:hypothetical protein
MAVIRNLVVRVHYYGRIDYFHGSWLEGTFGDRRGEPGEVPGICRDTRAGYSGGPQAVC